MQDIATITGQQSTPSEKQAAYISAIHEAARKAQKTGWGADGEIKGVEEEVRSNRLWLDPNFPIEFSEADIAQARTALIAHTQQTSIRVVKIPNPAAIAASYNGEPEQDLLIVDIDGALIFTAAALTSIDTFRVKVEEYAGSYYKLLIRMLGTKTQQYQLRRVGIGRMYLHIKAAYETEQQYKNAHSEKSLPEWPSMPEMAKRIGISEKDLRFCIAMAESPLEIIDLVESGRLTEDQLREISSSIADPEQRLQAAQQVAEQNASLAKIMPRQEVREAVQQLKLESGEKAVPRTKIQWHVTSANQPRADVAQLWGVSPQPGQQELPVPVVLGRALHDIQYALSLGGLPEEATTLISRLQAILQKKEIQALIETVDPYQE